MTRGADPGLLFRRLTGGRASAQVRSRGIALVAVLWVLVLLSLVAANLTSTSRADISMARNVTAAVEARLLADAAVERAVFELLAPRPGDPWVPDGRVRPLELENGAVLVSIQDEAGKLDLNYGSEDLLRNLLQELGLETEAATSLVDRVADYRDEDDLRRLNGAEADDYLRLDLPFGPADADFRAIDELRRVPGITPRIYAELKGLVTIHSQSAEVDPVLAPERLLRVLTGVDAGTIATVLGARGAAGDAGLGNMPSPAEATEPREGVFTILAEAQTASGGHYRRLAVIRTSLSDDPPFTILDWRQDLDSWAGEDNIGSGAEARDPL